MAKLELQAQELSGWAYYTFCSVNITFKVHSLTLSMDLVSLPPIGDYVWNFQADSCKVPYCGLYSIAQLDISDIKCIG